MKASRAKRKGGQGTLAVCLFAIGVLLCGNPRSATAQEDPFSIVNSKHNLSISGPGDAKATAETEICLFCHAPHAAGTQGPLWNRKMPATIYTPYQSDTLVATVGQPTGASKLCLSCHDGTIALGMVENRSTPIPMATPGGFMPAGPGLIGSDISGHHPVSFTYDSALAIQQGKLRDPVTLRQEVKLDASGQMQCTSCHDPHRNRYGNFLVKDNTASGLCTECHVDTSWSSSIHAVSPATWSGTGQDPWPRTTATTVADNACENCHAPHAAGTKPQLLRFSKVEDNCLVCHGGSVAAKNITAELNKASNHPIFTTASLHRPGEPTTSVSGRHTACADCHNPHAAQDSSLGGAGISKSLLQTRGENAAGVAVSVATKEYEICFRCHAETGTGANTKVARLTPQPNVRLDFVLNNRSHHAVIGPETAGRTKSLISPLVPGSQIKCTDCHNNDQGPGANGTGPRGPHGSRYAPLLERNLVQEDGQLESVNTYALCYKCHSQTVILGDALHRDHVQERHLSCVTCHDAHGSATQPYLINFNTIYVKPYNGQISFTDLGNGRASCTLMCHSAEHSNRSY